MVLSCLCFLFYVVVLNDDYVGIPDVIVTGWPFILCSVVELSSVLKSPFNYL